MDQSKSESQGFQILKKKYCEHNLLKELESEPKLLTKQTVATLKFVQPAPYNPSSLQSNTTPH